MLNKLYIILLLLFLLLFQGCKAINNNYDDFRLTFDPINSYITPQKEKQLTIVNKILKESKQNEYYFFAKGYEALYKGKPEEAITEFEKSIEKNSQFLYAYYWQIEPLITLNTEDKRIERDYNFLVNNYVNFKSYIDYAFYLAEYKNNTKTSLPYYAKGLEMLRQQYTLVQIKNNIQLKQLYITVLKTLDYLYEDNKEKQKISILIKEVSG